MTSRSMTASMQGILTLMAVWGCFSLHEVRADDDLDRQLLESLEGRTTPDSPIILVNRLLENTESSRRRLTAGQLDEETAAIQQQILDDIDALLAQSTASPPGSPPPPSGDSQSPPNGSEPSSPSQGTDAAPGDSPAEPNGAPADDPNAASRESTERTAAAKETAAERERRLGLATAAWGHLPPKVREQMRSAFSETYLPKYDELVRRYYEALAARRDGHETSAPPKAP
ncbi:MAG: hypothetical protein AB7I48_20130 [Planctomycetaceae bacterium]